MAESSSSAVGSANAFASYVALQTQALDIVREACTGRDELVSRIADLELELGVWKDAQRKEVSAREEAQRALRNLEDAETLAVCLIDGDGCLFDRTFVSRGRDGGRDAAQALQKHISHLASETVIINKKPTIIAHVYFNKQGLSRVLQELGIATDATFSAFVQGFNQAHPLFLMTDVGGLKEAADAKFRESLRLYAQLPACKLLVAGCSSDGGYAHQLQSLKTEGYDWKVHLIRSSEVAFAIKQLGQQEVDFDGLFEKKKLVMYLGSGASSNTNAAAPASTPTTMSAALKTPKKMAAAAVKSEWTPATTSKKTTQKHVIAAVEEKENGFVQVAGKLRAIDPKKALSRQNPPPCNAFYLKGECNRPDTCPYAHDYRLSAQNLATLRSDAKKSPCHLVARYKACNDPDCTAGHTCPGGVSCRFGSSCRFTAAMHPGGRYPKGDRSDSSDDYDTEEDVEYE